MWDLKFHNAKIKVQWAFLIQGFVTCGFNPIWIPNLCMEGPPVHGVPSGHVQSCSETHFLFAEKPEMPLRSLLRHREAAHGLCAPQNMHLRTGMHFRLHWEVLCPHRFQYPCLCVCVFVWEWIFHGYQGPAVCMNWIFIFGNGWGLSKLYPVLNNANISHHNILLEMLWIIFILATEVNKEDTQFKTYREWQTVQQHKLDMFFLKKNFFKIKRFPHESSHSTHCCEAEWPCSSCWALHSVELSNVLIKPEATPNTCRQRWEGVRARAQAPLQGTLDCSGA